MLKPINLWWVWLRLSCDEAHYLQRCFFFTCIGNIELAFRFSCFKSFKYIFNKHYSQKCPCKMCKWFTKNCTSFVVVPSPPADDHDRNSRKPSPVARMYAQFTGTWLKIHIWIQCCQETVWTVDVRLHFCFPPNENLTTGCLSNTLTLLSGRHMPSTVKVIAFQACAVCLHNVWNRGLSLSYHHIIKYWTQDQIYQELQLLINHNWHVMCLDIMIFFFFLL